MKIPPYTPLAKGGWGDFHINSTSGKGIRSLGVLAEPITRNKIYLTLLEKLYIDQNIIIY